MSQRSKAIAVVLLAILAAACGSADAENEEAAVFVVKKGDLRITLSESGTLEARNKVDIRPNIKTGANIISVVEEGSLVKKGDVLVELDKEAIEKEIENLQDTVIQLEANLENAKTDLTIQKDDNQSSLEKATLALEFSELEERRYLEGDSKQQRRDRELRVRQAKSKRDQAKEKNDKMPELRKRGFVTKVEVEEQALVLEAAEAEVEKAVLDLDLFESYTYPMTVKQKRSDVVEAKRELERVQALADSRTRAKEAVLRQRQRQYDAAVSRLEEAQALIKEYTITAPQDGIVLYGGRRDRWGNREDDITVGTKVFPGRTIIELPDLTMMDAHIQVHQADIRKLKLGQKAWVSLPGQKGKKFSGKISSIGSVAQSTSWRDPVRRFDVVVALEDKVEGLRAGVTVEVEIDVGVIADVLHVPLQAVDSTGGSYHVFLANGDTVRRREVRLGRANEQFVEVLDGLSGGERILLTSPQVVEEEGGEEKAGKPEQRQPGRSRGAPGGGRRGGGSGR